MRLASFISVLLPVTWAAGVLAADRARRFTVPTPVQTVLAKYCGDCHANGEDEGGLRLDMLGTLKEAEQLELLNKTQLQVFLGQMPPEDAEQPNAAERGRLAEWLSKELGKHNASKLEEKLKQPEYGNYVDHDKLFSGEYTHLKGFTYDRRWLVSEFIFNDTVNRLLDYQGERTIDGQRMGVIGDNGVNLGTRFGGASLRQSITNPFLLPSRIGVRYYDTTMLTGGHLLTMISNAKKIAGYMSSEQTMKTNYPAMYGIMQQELEHRVTLRSREQFLEIHIERLLQDIYQEKHAALLPKFVRVKVEQIPEYTDAKGKPKKKTNLGVLSRYTDEDLRAIYLGIGLYKQDGLTFDEVTERCEKDWFAYGIHEKRICSRVTIMKILHRHWDMALVYEDVRKKNIRPAKYELLSKPEMEVITAALVKYRNKGDRYQQVIDKCMAAWTRAFDAKRETASTLDDSALGDLVIELFAKIFHREPTHQELSDNLALVKEYLASLTTQESIGKLIESLVLSSEVVYRHEFGHSVPDEHGRRMMSPRDAAYALALALTDSGPDEQLVAAAEAGRLSTREDYRREVTRMLKRRDQYYIIDETVQKNGFNSSITNTPIRKLRFFREFFGYAKALTIFKDDARFGANRYDSVKGRLVDEADMLVDHILQKDKNVIEELLTTEKFYVYHSGDNEAMRAASDRLRKIYDYFKDKDWENFNEQQLYKHWDFIKAIKMRGTVFADFAKNAKRKQNWVRSFKSQMASYTLRFAKGQKAAAPFDATPMAYWHKSNASTRTGQQMRGPEVSTFFGIDHRAWDYPTTQPAKVAHRKGLLTHPAWLIAHSLNTETDPVRRGKWVREKLLAGTIPDVPITVDAVVPEDHHKTLRQRLAKATGSDYCWRCHQKMNPLGLAFEMYDDFGRYRTEEQLEHPENLLSKGGRDAPRENGVQRATYKTLPVDSRGVLEGTGDATLDGEVHDAIDLTQRLGKSARVRQSIIRHAFRYFMGRNEVLSDSKTLIDADRAYAESGGSFDAVIVSLLTSDSFIYRKATES